MVPMIRATLGFIFTADLTQVLLIHKRRPDWQAGSVNGIGGKCETRENYTKCIARETLEETNVLIPASQWKHFATLKWQTWQVRVFATRWSGTPAEARAQTDEMIEWFEVKSLPANIRSNLSWLIPLAIDAFLTPELPIISVKYQGN